jgi:hypothetical protein
MQDHSITALRSSLRTMTAWSEIFFVLQHLQTSTQGCYTTISPDHSPTCPSREMYVTSSYTTTNPNAILGLPISGFDDNTVFAAYKTQFEFWESKGYKIKLNVMDNQCTKQIKKFLSDNDCELMLVEPHNHHVNSAERTIQTFKDHFISALATTDSEFPQQLWDKLTAKVETPLNLMRVFPNQPQNIGIRRNLGPV